VQRAAPLSARREADPTPINSPRILSAESDINEWFVVFLLGIGDFEAFAEAMRDSPRRKSGGSRSDHK
jgi:hypothetical protein